MHRWGVVFLVLAGCATAPLRSSGTHVDVAKIAFDRGDYDTAEKEYTLALERAEGSGAAWARAEAKHGKARIAIVRMRSEIAPWRNETGDPIALLDRVRRTREILRTFGGDAAVDAELVAIGGVHAERWVSDAEARANRGELFAAARSVALLAAVLDVPANVIERANALRARAIAASVARANAAGTTHPLTVRLQQGLQAALGGGSAPDSTALLAPFARGVKVTVEAPSGCALAALPARLDAVGISRHATVRVSVATCSAQDSERTSEATATWTEKVLAGYDTVDKPEKRCVQRCGSVLTGGETCTTNYNTSPPSLLCTKNTQSSCFDECTTVMVPTKVERFVDEQREAKRTVTTKIATVTATGSWVVTYNGKDIKGAIAIANRNEFSTAPAIGGAPASTTGTLVTATRLADTSIESTANAVQAALATAFAADAAAAQQRARAASARIDDEEEEWLRSVLLGGTDLGPLAERYDLDRERLTALFQSQFTLLSPSALPAPTAFESLERGETALVTQNDADFFAAAVLPTFAGKYWLQFDAGYYSLPTQTTSSAMEFGGDSAFVVGVRAGTRVIGRKDSMWGWRLADELSGAVGLGGRLGGTEIVDNSLASFAANASGHYAIGAGLRRPGKGGLFAGVRASYEAFLVGASSGSYTAVPLFVRVEAPLVFGTVGAEATGFSLAGSSQWGLSVHFTDQKRWQGTRRKYIQLRIERSTVDATYTDFGVPTPMDDGALTLDDAGLTSVHILYGAGW